MSDSANKTKVVVITGASAGIGLSCAEVFAENGWALALGARRVEKLREAEADLKKRGAKDVLCASLDVCDSASVKAFAAAVNKKYPHVDTLINNAGMAIGMDPVATVKESDWQVMLSTNIEGLMRTTQAFVPAMQARGSGHVINLSSIAAHTVYEGGGIYAATKHAVRALTNTMRLELTGSGVRVGMVSPGMVETDFSKVRFPDDAGRAAAVYKGLNPLTGRDIADAIYFMASRPAHFSVDDMILMPHQQAVGKVVRK